LYSRDHPRFALFASKGSLLVGDVHPEVAEVAGALTPVPGGVGPLTITMLMMNTLSAARQRTGALHVDAVGLRE
jgi:methylenetetrahydrofolate dehydrogenase (NADP+)/methenyltetrahydrofolate cyclohydrolase